VLYIFEIGINNSMCSYLSLEVNVDGIHINVLERKMSGTFVGWWPNCFGGINSTTLWVAMDYGAPLEG